MAIRKYATHCPPGYHKASDGCRLLVDGKPTGDLYVPKATLQNKESVKRFKGKGEDIEQETPKEKHINFTPEQEETIKRNMEKIKLFIADMMRDSDFTKKFAPVLLPYVSYHIAYNECTKKLAEMNEKAQSKIEREQTKQYGKTLDEILKSVPDLDFDMLSDSDQKKVVDELKKKLESEKERLKQIVIKKGKAGRNTVEYAQYRAYADYIKMCEVKSTALKIRLENEAKKQEKKMNGENQEKPKSKAEEMREQFKGKNN